ncbi:MAG: hypothetical protein ACE5E5_01450 [Phycisphaerae bacterium]
MEALTTRAVFEDCRPGMGLRVSSHLFDTDEQVEEALRAIFSVIS